MSQEERSFLKKNRFDLKKDHFLPMFRTFSDGRLNNKASQEEEDIFERCIPYILQAFKQNKKLLEVLNPIETNKFVVVIPSKSNEDKLHLEVRNINPKNIKQESLEISIDENLIK